MIRNFCAVFLVAIFLAAVPAQAQAFSDPHHQMLLKAFVNLKRAEAYDQNCNRGKITGQVKAKGHSANFDKNRQLLSDELNKGFRETTKGSDAEVNGILQQIANDASAQMKKDIDRNGCYTEEADHAEGVLKLFSSIEPQFLFRSLQEHIALEVGKSQ